MTDGTKSGGEKRTARGIAALFGGQGSNSPGQTTPPAASAPHAGRVKRDHATARTVTEVVNASKTVLERRFPRVHIKGELSGFREYKSSGHWYFDLKDDRSVLAGVMFRSQNGRVGFAPADGMAVRVHGKVSVYQRSSKVQIIVEDMEPEGQGALAIAFEKMKARLSKEGLFDAAHKQPLPMLPRTVGIVTSPAGAGLQDILRILRLRMPGINVLLSPTRVQGPGSADEIAAAVRRLDQTGACDVMIVGRGGGSLEDLWSFNEEVVARALFDARTPTISAVGHETDHSIADLVADRRVATPSHAAQLAVPDLRELNARLDAVGRRLHNPLALRVARHNRHLADLERRLGKPADLLWPTRQALDELGARLERAAVSRMVGARRAVERAEAALSRHAPGAVLDARRRSVRDLGDRLTAAAPHSAFAEAGKRIAVLEAALAPAMHARLNAADDALALGAARLAALSPLSVLSRGYGVLQHVDKKGSLGAVVQSTSDVRPGQDLSVRLADGRLAVRVGAKQPLSAAEHAAQHASAALHGPAPGDVDARSTARAKPSTRQPTFDALAASTDEEKP